MIDITPYLGIVYAVIGIGGTIAGLKVVLNSKFLKTKADAKVVEKKAEYKGKGLVATAMDLIETGDEKQALLNREIEKLRAQGVTDEQMQNLLFEKKIVDLACHPVAKLAGGPIVQVVSKFAKGLGVDI